MADEPLYWAFISYSHCDRPVAQWLHRSLERYPIPKALVGRDTRGGPAPRRFKPIFRDREELAANSDLSAHINAALDQSAYLIVICSPAAAQSRWVEQEIVRFKAHHDDACVLAIIAAGEPYASQIPGREHEECLPRALRFSLGPDGAAIGQAEPVAADLRSNGDGRRPALLKLLAGMLGVRLDLIAQRDARRRQRLMMAAVGASSAISVALAALSVAAVRASNEAHKQQMQAEGMIEFMIGDLRKRLEPAGRLDVLDAVGARAMSYYAAQPEGGLDVDSLGRRSRVLHMVGDLRETRGDIPGAMAVFQAAASTTKTLLLRTPNDPQRIFDHAQSVYYVGYMALRRGDRAEAHRQFLEYKRLADQLTAIDPHNPDWQAEVGYANTSLGTVMLLEGDAKAARLAFAAATRILRRLADEAPLDVGRQLELGTGYAWLADSEAVLAPDAAMNDRMTERGLYQKLLAKSATNRRAAIRLVVNRGAVAKLHLARGEVAAGREELRRAAAEGEALTASEPNDLKFRAGLATIYNLMARSQLNTGDLDAAAAAGAKARALAEGLVAKDATDSKWQGAQLGEARLLQVEIAAARARTPALRRRALAPVVAEADRLGRLATERPDDAALATLAAEALVLRGDLRTLLDQPELAEADWRHGLDILDLRPASARAAAEDRDAALRSAASQRLARRAEAGANGLTAPFPKLPL